MIQNGNFIKLYNKQAFIDNHQSNKAISLQLGDEVWRIMDFNSSSSIVNRLQHSETGEQIFVSISNTELVRYFQIERTMDCKWMQPNQRTSEEDNRKYGKFKIIVTYIEENTTIEEEGVTYIKIEENSVLYRYNRKRLGFMKYNGEVQLSTEELKQITISTPDYDRVLHIEKGIVIREHIMYNEEKKFKGLRVD